MGWDTGTTDILTIPLTKDGSTKQLNLLSHYGLIDEEDIRAQCLTYCHAATRQAQNNCQLAACILNSLSVDGRKTIASEPSKYHTDDTLATQPGPMLFKIIMSKDLVDNKSTTSMYRGSLQTLKSTWVCLTATLWNSINASRTTESSWQTEMSRLARKT
jgi:hypothetical protein